METTLCQDTPLYCLSSTNKWPNGTCQSRTQTIPSVLLQLPARQLVHTPSTCPVCDEQPISLWNTEHPILSHAQLHAPMATNSISLVGQSICLQSHIPIGYRL